MSAKRILEVFDTSRVSPTARHGGANNRWYADSWSRGVHDVSFAYPDAREPMLEQVSPQPGQTVAFIGSTGSGKTTLVNLVPRFYDATDGGLVDGKE